MDSEHRSGPTLLTRRKFLGAALAGTGVLAAGPAWSRRSHTAKAIVIGSGFGGAVAALRLAQAGIETLVLERGRRWDITPTGDTFGSIRHPDGRLMWFSDRVIAPGIPEIPIDRFAGVLEVLRAPALDVYAGAGVGGGSLVYGTTLIQPSETAFRASLPGSIDYRQMDRTYYRRAKAMLGAATIPDDILATPTYLFARTSLAHLRRADLPVFPAPAGVDFDVVRDELLGRVVPSFITGEFVLFGANSGAKNSVDRNYLAQAEATGRVEVRPLNRVTHIGR